MASGLPKPAELAVVAGSTYVISTERAVPDAILDRLSLRGLGLRRHEGFGDLAPPPVLKPGRRAREQQQRHRRDLMDAVAALRGVPVRFPRLWPATAGGHDRPRQRRPGCHAAAWAASRKDSRTRESVTRCGRS